jgi:hypothetical protein
MLPDLAEGTLSGPGRAEVDAHLADCAGCRADLVSLRRALSWLNTDVSLEPPAELVASVMRQIEASGPVFGDARRSSKPVPASSSRAHWPFGWLVGALATGLAVTALAVAFLTAPGSPRHPGANAELLPEVVAPHDHLTGDASLASSLEPRASSLSANEALPVVGTVPGATPLREPAQSRTATPEPAPPTATTSEPSTSPTAAGPALGLTPARATTPSTTATTGQTPPLTGTAAPPVRRPGPVRTIGDGF